MISEVSVWLARRFGASSLAFFLIFAVILTPLFGLSQTVIRVGAFPNITHAQPMIGKANAWFDKAMGPNVKASVDKL